MMKYIPIIFFYLVISMAYGQKVPRAEKLYQKGKYSEAKKRYHTLIAKGKTDSTAFLKMANMFYDTGDYLEAEKWYTKWFFKTRPQDPLTHLRYLQTLLSARKLKEAKTQLKALTQKGVLTIHNELDTLYLSEHGDHLRLFDINTLDFNHMGFDYGASVSKDTLYFTSNRVEGHSKKEIDPWSGAAYTDLYKVPIESNRESFGIPVNMGVPINSVWHESTVAFDQKGKTIYFTGTDRNSENKEGRPTLHIYRSHKIDGHWGAVEDLSINDSTFSNAHPALSPDGKTLYFVSDREGSLGQTDIFYCSIGDDGTLGLPKNIGKEVNTIGRESFPFVSEDGILFFASDGRLGQGGLDIFLYPLNEGSGAYNLGKSINGPFDDYAIFMQKGSKHGFFSSNRTGNDNIYRLTQLLPFEALTHMTQTLRLTDSSNGMPIFGASVRVFDSEGKLLAHTITDQEGHFELNLPRGQKFDITIEKEGYNDSNWSFDRPIYISDLKMALEPKPNFKFKNVYFAFNSASLVEKAKADLDTIAHTLQTSPKVHLHIHSYTDSRGSKAYNLKLSEQRMRAVRDYLKEKGIMESRLFGQAHGEEDLIIPCTDGIPCTEEQHSKNRRTEFIVSKDL